MIIRTSTVLSVASLVAAFAGLPVAAGEWATKEDAIAMVQRAVVFITQQGREKAYAEITKKLFAELQVAESRHQGNRTPRNVL
jgi:hypothetical protein